MSSPAPLGYREGLTLLPIPKLQSSSPVVVVGEPGPVATFLAPCDPWASLSASGAPLLPNRKVQNNTHVRAGAEPNRWPQGWSGGRYSSILYLGEDVTALSCRPECFRNVAKRSLVRKTRLWPFRCTTLILSCVQGHTHLLVGLVSVSPSRFMQWNMPCTFDGVSITCHKTDTTLILGTSSLLPDIL